MQTIPKLCRPYRWYLWYAEHVCCMLILFMGKCHEMSNVMKCQMSWNVKCHELSNVIKSQKSWNVKCHEMSRVMKCQISWNFNIKCQEMTRVMKCQMLNVMKCQESWNVKCHEMSSVYSPTLPPNAPTIIPSDEYPTPTYIFKSRRPEGPKAGPKDCRLEAGARRAPKLLVYL